VKATIYAHLVEIHWTFWAIALVLQSIDLWRREFVPYNINGDFDGALIIALSLLDIFLATWCRMKIWKVYRILTASPATYYNDQLPELDILAKTDDDHSTRRDDLESLDDGPPSSADRFEDLNGEVLHVNRAGQEISGDAFDEEQPIRRVSVDVPTASRILNTMGLRNRNLIPGSGINRTLESTRSPNHDPRRASFSGPLGLERVGRSPPPNSQSHRGDESHGLVPGSHAEHAITFDLPLTRYLGHGHSALRELNVGGPSSRSSTMSSMRRDSNMSELAAYFPLDELIDRDRDRLSESGSDSESVRSSIARHREEILAAQRESPIRQYPRWVYFFIPRLKRVAAPVEKLFWFASHRFFLWSIQLTLFSASLLASTMIATLFVAHRSFAVIHWVALALAVANVAFCLLQSASSLRTYTYVINAASLVSDDLVAQAVEQVIDSRALRFRSEDHDVPVPTQRKRPRLSISRKRRRVESPNAEPSRWMETNRE